MHKELLLGVWRLMLFTLGTFLRRIHSLPLPLSLVLHLLNVHVWLSACSTSCTWLLGFGISSFGSASCGSLLYTCRGTNDLIVIFHYDILPRGLQLASAASIPLQVVSWLPRPLAGLKGLCHPIGGLLMLFKTGCGCRWTMCLTHFHLFSQLTDDISTLWQGGTLGLRPRKFIVSRVYFRFEVLHSIRECLIFNAELGYQSFDILLILSLRTLAGRASMRFNVNPLLNVWDIDFLASVEGHLIILCPSLDKCPRDRLIRSILRLQSLFLAQTNILINRPVSKPLIQVLCLQLRYLVGGLYLRVPFFLGGHGYDLIREVVVVKECLIVSPLPPVLLDHFHIRRQRVRGMPETQRSPSAATMLEVTV
jgi:hypothetical protein